MKWYGAFIAVLVCSSVAQADVRIRGQMRPLPHELLEQPINLNKHCVNVQVVEWRGTSGRRKTTAPSQAAKKVINSSCNLALSKMSSFIRMKGLVATKPVKIKLALMPASVRFEGTSYRNLNDLNYRFYYRARQDVRYVWGYTHENGYIFLRNDVLQPNKTANPQFVFTLIHEMWHAFSLQAGIFNQLADNENDRYEADERMAEDFTEYLGLGRYLGE